jgi:hypothetical protein
MLHIFHEQIGMEPHSVAENYFVRTAIEEMDHCLKLILEAGKDYLSRLAIFLVRES